MAAMALRFDPDRSRYVSLATYRRNGAEVRTPVWLAADGARYYVFSAGQAGKVKRINANGRARIAHSDVRGNVLGPWLDADARIVFEPEVIKRAYAALRRKYGWQMRLLDFFSALGGKINQRALIELTPAA